MYLFLVLLSPVILTVFIKLLFALQRPEKVAAKYKDKPVSLLVKKYKEADEKQYRTTFLLLGLLLSLSFVLYAFNFATSEPNVAELDFEIPDIDSVEIVPPQTAPPPPPPPPVIPPLANIEVVEDDVEIIEPEPEVDIEEIENQIIEEPIPPQPVVDPNATNRAISDALAGLDAIDEEDLEEEIIEEEEEEEEELAEEEPEIFVVVETMPEFPGGQSALFKFINENIKYPPMARENGIDGTIYVGFIIDETGKVTNPTVKRGVRGGSLNEEALRVVKLMPSWVPGEQRGKKVKVAYTIPIKFVLQ